jgi:hypothetical protein
MSRNSGIDLGAVAAIFRRRKYNPDSQSGKVTENVPKEKAEKDD